MKAVVEFGRPKTALEGAPCGVTGSMTCASLKQANLLAYQVRHVLSARKYQIDDVDNFLVSKNNPRIVWWADDLSCWVAVTIIKEGYLPGAYGAVADKFARIALGYKET